MSVEYDYTKEPVATDSLTEEIQNSGISTALDYTIGIISYGNELSIFFMATLSDADKAILDAVVAAHAGVPLPENQSTLVNFATQAPDGRSVMATNRIPSGYSIYPTGSGDNIANGTYANGAPLKMNDTSVSGGSNVATAQFLNHWYGIGGRVVWESACLDDSVSAVLIAPSSSGWTNATGNFNKQGLGGPYHMLVPVAPGTGSWSVDLTQKLINTQILASTPVPCSPSGTGWFDYDSATNILTPNMNHKGNFNLYDFDINLFRFANNCWGRKQDGSESWLESTDVVGKLLYNSWKIKFTLNCVTSGVRCGVVITTAMMKNI